MVNGGANLIDTGSRTRKPYHKDGARSEDAPPGPPSRPVARLDCVPLFSHSPTLTQVTVGVYGGTTHDGRGTVELSTTAALVQAAREWQERVSEERAAKTVLDEVIRLAAEQGNTPNAISVVTGINRLTVKRAIDGESA